jgi:unsaturated rhamnogalacturonyl hydrolase
LDHFFNSEKRKDISGKDSYWHYTWEERSNGGFSFLSNIFERYGAKLSSLDIAPTEKNLKQASVYIIVDPDHLKDNLNPNYVSANDVKAITNWVKAGGTLLLMANDSSNCELTKFNDLAGVFGIQFTNESINMVKNDQFQQGEVSPTMDTVNFIFRNTNKMFLKELSVLSVKTPAVEMLTKGADIIIAIATYGKGKVLAVGDPWLYNEYVDGRKLPAEYENYKAAEDLVKWLLGQTSKW